MTKSSARYWAILVGFLLGLVFWWLIQHITLPARRQSMQPGMAVSAEQLHSIADAIQQYEKEHGTRPEKLTVLVDEGLLRPEDMLDHRRPILPALTPDTRLENIDLLYFPALEAPDPGDLVLLCTLLVHEEDEKYHVILNDGQYRTMNSTELVAALNGTYEYIGKTLQNKGVVLPATARQ